MRRRAATIRPRPTTTSGTPPSATPMLDPIMEELSSLSPALLHHFIWAGVEQQRRRSAQGTAGPARFLPGSRRASSLARPRCLSPGSPRLPRKRGPHARRVRHGGAGGGLFHADRQVLQPHRASGQDQETPPAEQPPVDGHILSRRPAEGERRMEAVHARSLRSCSNQGTAEQVGGLGSRSLGHAGQCGAPGVCHLHLFQAPAGVLVAGGRAIQRGGKGERAQYLALQRLSHGDPETILYTTGAEAKEIYKIAYMCEPAPDADSIAVANGLIQAIPRVVDVTDPAEIQSVTNSGLPTFQGSHRKPARRSVRISEDPRHRDAVPLSDEATHSANAEGRANGQIGKLFPASPDFRV